MTAHELDEPRMIYMGPPPPHFLRAEAPGEDPAEAEPGEPANLVLPVALTGAAALVAGVAIGVFATLTVRPSPTLAHTQAPAAAARQPAVSDAPPIVEAAQSEPPKAAEPPLARAAVALLTSAPPQRTGPDPQNAVADQGPRHTRQRSAGAAADAMPNDRIGWLLTQGDSPARSAGPPDEAPH